MIDKVKDIISLDFQLIREVSSYFTNSLPLVIAVDGPDGAGKSTITKHICNKYFCITPPHFISLGLMPQEARERRRWYRNDNAFLTMKAYLSSHQKRYEFLEQYNKGMHYKQPIHFRQVPIIVWDRGPLSAKAYAFAAIKLHTDLPNTIVVQFINQHFNYKIPLNQVLSITLYSDLKNTKRFLSRIVKRDGIKVDKRIEEELIKGQILFHQNFYKQEVPTLKLNPFSTLEDNLTLIDELIGKILSEKQKALNYTIYECNRILLSKVLNDLMRRKRYGKIILLKDIVENGYTDKKFKIYLENANDKLLLDELPQIYNIVKEYNKDDFHIVINPEETLTEQK